MNFGNLEINKLEIVQIARKHGVKNLYLFGSALGDDFSDTSDIDLMIEFIHPEKPSLFDLIDLKNELEDLIGRSVDLVEKGSIKNPFRKESIYSSAVLIYAE